jgi:hypothetical protein
MQCLLPTECMQQISNCRDTHCGLPVTCATSLMLLHPLGSALCTKSTACHLSIAVRFQDGFLGAAAPAAAAPAAAAGG